MHYFVIESNKIFYSSVKKYIKNYIAAVFEADIKFYMLALYTHMGNVTNTGKCIEFCDKYMENIKNNWKSIEYHLKYINRKLIDRINQFDFDNAKRKSDSLVEECKKIKEAIEIWSDNSEFKFDALVKALGSQVQIYTFLLRGQQRLYKNAVEISE